MPLLGNTIIFVDMSFLRSYKVRDKLYKDLLEFCVNREIIICTSNICVEEWRTQKVSDLNNHLQDINNKIKNAIESN
ncbi:MAG: hypothetical protein ABW189_06485, partial [Rickettsiales bacterium]